MHKKPYNNIPLDSVIIEQGLGDCPPAIEVFQEIDSTNLYLKNCNNMSAQRICLAEQQTAGRGRMGRYWYSPSAENLYLSFLYPFNMELPKLTGLSLVVGISCIEALEKLGIKEKIELKWPNDGMYQGKKLFGILVETQASALDSYVAIIGIGMNVNMCDFTEELVNKCASLYNITGEYLDRNLLAIELIETLRTNCKKLTTSSLASFSAQWQKYDGYYGKTITINNQNYNGIARGIDAQGNLLLELADGTIKILNSGDIN